MLDLIVPFFVAMAVLFHRLFGIAVWVRQGFIYGTTSAALAMVFGAAVLGLGWVGQHLWRQTEQASVAVAAAVAGLLDYLIDPRQIGQVVRRDPRQAFHQVAHKSLNSSNRAA